MENTSNINPPFKTQGPIRWGAFVPLMILGVTGVLYFIFLFDTHMKWVLEKSFTWANGAKVDIGSFHTSLWRSEMEMGRVQVADADAPMTNRLEIGKIHYQFLFRPVLQKKFVIKDASVIGLAYGTPRKYSGAVAKKKVSDKPGMLSQTFGRVEESLKQKAQESSLGTIEGLVKGGDIAGQLKNMGEASHANQALKAAEASLNQGMGEWQKKVASLPTEQTVQGYKTRMESAAKNAPKSIEDIPKKVSELDAIRKDVTTSLDQVTSLQKTVSSGIDGVAGQLKGLDKAVEADINAARASLKIPSLNLKDMTPALLGPKLNSYLQKAVYWVEMSRKYMPKKSKAEAKFVPHVRAKGTDIHFIAEKVFPTFLLERALIQSNVSSSANAGNISGEILGLNTDPALYGKPTEIGLKGDFPAANIHGFLASVTLDHTGEEQHERFVLSAEHFPIQDWKMSEGADLALALNKANTSFRFAMDFLEDQFKTEFVMKLSGIDYGLKAQNAKLQTLLGGVLGGLKAFEVRGFIKAAQGNVDINLTSDLGAQIADAVAGEFKKELAAVGDQIRRAVEAKVEDQKKAVMKQLDDAKAKALAPIESKLASLRGIEGQLTAKKNELENQKDAAIKRVQSEAQAKVKAAEEEQKRRLREQAEKEAQKAKKNLKLPF